MKIRWWHFGLAIALLLTVISPLASSHPDGLERVAEDAGFVDRATAPPYQVIADYVFPGVQNEALATILAGIIGTLLIFTVVYGMARFLRRSQRPAPVTAREPDAD